MNKFFTLVKDPRRVKAGDLIIWKKEKGKTPKLHLSVSSMRALGLSIGRRWRALSYEQVTELVKNPKETRFYLVDSTEDATRTITDTLSFSSDPEKRKAQVTLCKFPMFPGETTIDQLKVFMTNSGFVRSAEIQSEYRFDPGLAFDEDGSWKKSDEENTSLCESARVSDAFTHMTVGGKYISPFTKDEWTKYSPSIYIGSEDGTLSRHDFAELCVKVLRNDSLVPAYQKFNYMPIKFVSESVKRGAVVIRPTKEFWEFWTKELTAVVKKRCTEPYEDLIKRIDVTIRMLGKERRDVMNRIRKLKSESTKELKSVDRTRKGVKDGILEYGE